MNEKHQGKERDDVLRRMLKMPPKPHKPLGKRSVAANQQTTRLRKSGKGSKLSNS